MSKIGTKSVPRLMVSWKIMHNFQSEIVGFDPKGGISSHREMQKFILLLSTVSQKIVLEWNVF